MCYTDMAIGVWLSPVECLVRDQEAAGSNPVTPMLRKPLKSLRFQGLSLFSASETCAVFPHELSQLGSLAEKSHSYIFLFTSDVLFAL